MSKLDDSMLVDVAGDHALLVKALYVVENGENDERSCLYGDDCLFHCLLRLRWEVLCAL